ncbi:metalloprotease TIKI2 [Caerostris extrusa]|uniref:Metalloprotease TIKI homolog n=1 Tax=Caerostris extrusa TaxID=172846 RepID=A0AAV4PP07_CAEEX|nr:metalloprotease TIKI2 [Caerostris extrusa]
MSWVFELKEYVKLMQTGRIALVRNPRRKCITLNYVCKRMVTLSHFYGPSNAILLPSTYLAPFMCHTPKYGTLSQIMPSKLFAISTHVYFRTGSRESNHPVSALSSCQMLPHGKNLSDVLPGDLYSRLKRHLEYVRGMMPHWMTKDQRGRGLYADYLFNAIAGNWERKRPVWVMLMVNSLTESDVRSRGVPVLDLYLAQEAERLRKKTDAVEKVEEQCLPLNGLNFSQVMDCSNDVPFLIFWYGSSHHNAERRNGIHLKIDLKIFKFCFSSIIKRFTAFVLNSAEMSRKFVAMATVCWQSTGL